MKKALLVFGPSEKNAIEQAKMFQIRHEDSSGKIWRVVSEKDVLEHFVKTHNYDALCLSEWLAPIKNDVIVDLLSRTEKEAQNDYIEGIIVCGQFALDEEVRTAYVDILTEQGYEVTQHPVTSSWGLLLTECLTQRTSIKRALNLWNQFTKQFSRQYSPLEDSQPKAVVVSPEIATKKDTPGSFEIVVMLEALQARRYSILVIDVTDEIEGTKEAFKALGFPDAKVIGTRYPDSKKRLSSVKLDTFWTAVANNYDVKLVIEHDAETVSKWRDIGLPVISLTNTFDVEYIA